MRGCSMLPRGPQLVAAVHKSKCAIASAARTRECARKRACMRQLVRLHLRVYD